MRAKQLSIFLENKSGRLTEVTEALGRSGVNLTAMSIADNSDFGIKCRWTIVFLFTEKFDLKKEIIQIWK